MPAREPLKNVELQEPVAGIFPRGHEIGAFFVCWAVHITRRRPPVACGGHTTPPEGPAEG